MGNRTLNLDFVHTVVLEERVNGPHLLLGVFTLQCDADDADNLW